MIHLKLILLMFDAGKDLECVVWFTENIVFDKGHKCLSSHKYEEPLTIYCSIILFCILLSLNDVYYILSSLMSSLFETHVS